MIWDPQVCKTPAAWHQSFHQHPGCQDAEMMRTSSCWSSRSSRESQSPENPVVKSFPAPRVLDKKKSGQHRKILVGKDQGWMPLLGHWTHPCHSFPSRRAASKLHATIWSNVGIVLPAWREDIMLQRKFFSLKYREICKPGTSSQTEYTLQVQIYIYIPAPSKYPPLVAC